MASFKSLVLRNGLPYSLQTRMVGWPKVQNFLPLSYKRNKYVVFSLYRSLCPLSLPYKTVPNTAKMAQECTPEVRNYTIID